MSKSIFMVIKNINFLKLKNTFCNQKKQRKFLWISLTVIGTLVIGLGAMIAIYWMPTQQLMKTATAGRNSFLKAKDLLLEEDFNGAQTTLESTIKDFETSKIVFKKFLWLKQIPWIRTQVEAVDNLLSVGITTGQTIKEVASIASFIVAPLEQNNEINFSTLTPEQKHQLLENIYNAKLKLQEAKNSINDAVITVDQIPSNGLIKKIGDIVHPLKEQLPQLLSGLDQAITISQILPLIAGYPEQKTYLFLLENNTELAPSGGMIGTYGIAKIKDANIVSFSTDNVYNLDGPAEAWLDVPAPWPVASYNAAPKLFLRGASWSPDFPTTGQSAQWFYRQERGPEKNLDGTVAITPTLVESLLSITGKIQVDGLTFTSENFTELLEQQVEQDFLKKNIPLSRRKDIIGDLSNILLKDILSLPKSRWPELLKVLQKNLEEKQILLYSNNEYLQNLILKQNWGGAIKNVDHDYLTVIDANLASLKTDAVMKRSLLYQVEQQDDTLVVDVSFTYTNTGKITWKTTRYRTYVRVYVPEGSELISFDGAMTDCKKTQPGKVETTQELNKTVFGAFVCTEPGESKTFRLRYSLPSRIKDQINSRQYQLLIQKQAGVAPYQVTVSLNFDKNLKSFIVPEKTTVKYEKPLSFIDTLSQDRKYTIEFK